MFTYHLRSENKGCFNWGKVLAVEGSEYQRKCKSDKKPGSHSVTGVFLTEAAALAAFHSVPSCDNALEARLYPYSNHEATDLKPSPGLATQLKTQPGTSQILEPLYINQKHFNVPVEYIS